MPHNSEEQERNIIQEQAKKKGKKLIRDKALKATKAAAKKVAQVAAKVVFSVVKTLLTLLISIGGPYLLIIGGILTSVLLIFVATAMFFGDDPDSLDKESRELRDHIVAAADSTVDMTKPEQIPYRVPHELIIAAIQIYDADKNVNTKKAATELAEALKPIFEYETKEGKITTHIETCTDGSCSTSTMVTPFEVTLLVRVDAWDRVMTAEIIHELTPWETSSSTSTSTSVDEDGNETTSTTTTTYRSQSDFFYTEEHIEYDYTLFDRELSNKPFEYEEDSKKTVEAVYEITGGEIYYSEWLAGESIIAGMPGFDGTITPGAGVPPEYMEIYLAAEKKYGVDWYYLAAIHYTETKFSTHKPMISSVGAEGHMQFMPCTWLGWNYPGCKGGLGGVGIPDSIKHSPGSIKQYGGYGVDGNGDGKADPFDIWDAIFTAANYLSKSGFSTNVNKAIKNYNHSDTYVNNVVAKAKEYKDAASYAPNAGNTPNLVPGSFMKPVALNITSPYGGRDMGSYSSYHYGSDFSGATGTPIVASADGVVTAAQNHCPKVGYLGATCNGVGWGNYVKIKHVVQGKQYETVSAHMYNAMVRTGQTVKQGQQIGTLGTSGSSTGPHLHFEIHLGTAKHVKKGNKWVPVNTVNPALYIQ